MARRSENVIHLVGFGSQSRAWAQCLRTSGWRVHIYLARSESPSFQAALELGFEPALLMDLRARLEKREPSHAALVAMLCPDSSIGVIYDDVLAPLETGLTVILAHGYAVYAGDLKSHKPQHEIALLAPKAIGPKIWSLFQETPRGEYHRLVAGYHASAEREADVRAMAEAMGFALERLVQASFEQEAIGDLLSEQGLLCGGLFTLMEWTMETMRKAGVPPALIHEECITELELIAGLLRERGPATTSKTISQAAQCGTVAMQTRLEQSNAREHFQAQLDEVISKRFVDEFREGSWKRKAEALTQRLLRWETVLKEKPSQ
jgi:ketol-acid reductoisomerase